MGRGDDRRIVNPVRHDLPRYSGWSDRALAVTFAIIYAPTVADAFAIAYLDTEWLGHHRGRG